MRDSIFGLKKRWKFNFVRKSPLEFCSSADEGSGWYTQKLFSRDNSIEDLKTKLSGSVSGAFLMRLRSLPGSAEVNMANRLR